MQSLSELGIEICDEHPKPVTAEILAGVNLVITLGREVDLEPVQGAEMRNWDTDEPSTRGIAGMERMRLVRDDIHARATHLVGKLKAAIGKRRRLVALALGHDWNQIGRRYPLHHCCV